ncbi:MAG: hypothetical protein ISR91_00735 [Candidatus Delongbacteria bacterium]|nr:hypothetical protein [Candidatus Delongbacteria bacterium]
MQLQDLTPRTEATFLRCLHDEKPDDPRVIALRRHWVDSRLEKGYRAKVLHLDSGEIAGLGQYIPIEESFIQGERLMVILCLWVHGYDHHIGNRQGNGYGRFMLEQIEAEILATDVEGIVAWGMDFPYWNPVAFYEHMGYQRVDQEGPAVLVWKPRHAAAIPPRFYRQLKKPQARDGQVTLDVFHNGWCTGSCGQCITARDAVAGMAEGLRYREVDTGQRENLSEWGITDGTYLDGEPFRPDEPPFSSEELRREILDRVGAR